MKNISKVKVFLLLFALLPCLTACGTLNYWFQDMTPDEGFATDNRDQRIKAVATKSHQRMVLMADVYDTEDKEALRICLERTPDVAMQFAESFKFGGSTSSRDVNLTNNYVQTIRELGKTSVTDDAIQGYLYRLCEAWFNGSLGKQGYAHALSNFVPPTIVAMHAIESIQSIGCSESVSVENINVSVEGAITTNTAAAAITTTPQVKLGGCAEKINASSQSSEITKVYKNYIDYYQETQKDFSFAVDKDSNLACRPGLELKGIPDVIYGDRLALGGCKFWIKDLNAPHWRASTEKCFRPYSDFGEIKKYFDKKYIEKKEDCRVLQQISQDELTKLISKREMTCKLLRRSKGGYLYGSCELRDGRDLKDEAISAGIALPYPLSEATTQTMTTLGAMQKERNKGIWRFAKEKPLNSNEEESQ